MDDFDWSSLGDYGDMGGFDISSLDSVDLGSLLDNIDPSVFEGLDQFNLDSVGGLDELLGADFSEAAANLDTSSFSPNVLEDISKIGTADDLFGVNPDIYVPTGTDLFATTNTPDDVAAALVGPESERDFQTYLDKYGEVTFDTPDGFVTYRADGTVETGTDEGRRSYYHTDPSGKNYFVDYSNINDPNAMVETVDRSASGATGRNYYFDGNYVGYDPRGTVTTAGPSGSGAAKTVYNRDGSVTEYKNDGSKVTHYKDGSKTTTSPKGDQTRTGAPDSKKKSLLETLMPLLLAALVTKRKGSGINTQPVLPKLTAEQRQTPYTQMQQTPGYRPGQGGMRYFEPLTYTQRMAGGGIIDLAKALAAKRREQRKGLLMGRGDGVSDSIPATIDGERPARLARGEYVVDARTVAELGNGSTDAGAERLDEMRKRVLQKRKKAKVGQDSKARQDLPE